MSYPGNNDGKGGMQGSVRECREMGNVGECEGTYKRNVGERGECWGMWGNVVRSGNETGPPWDPLADEPVSEKFNGKLFQIYF